LYQPAVEFSSGFSHIVVGFVVQRGLAGGDVLALESVVYDVLSAPEERVYGVFEECGVVTVYIERNGDSTPNLDVLYVERAIIKYRGVGLLLDRGLIPSCRLHPTAKPWVFASCFL
jgi:hypothetical protein